MISESDSDTELHASRLAAISRKESRKRVNRKYYSKLKNKKSKRPKVKYSFIIYTLFIIHSYSLFIPLKRNKK